MDDSVIQAILVQGGLGTVAAVFIWLYLQEKKDRKAAQDENKLFQKEFNEHLRQDIDDKNADRDTLKAALDAVQGVRRNV